MPIILDKCISGYDVFGRKSTVSHSNGLEGMMTYDELNRTTNITWTGAGENFSEAIAYNSQTGNIDQIEREFGMFNYNHDITDQLTGMAYTGTTQLPNELVNRTITHDHAGNRATDTVNGITKTHSNVILENDKFKILSDEDGLGRIWQKVYKQENKTDIFNYQTDGKLIRFRRYENNQLTRDVRYFTDALQRRVAKNFKINGQEWTNNYNHLLNFDQILTARSGTGAEVLFADGFGLDEHFGKIEANGPLAFVTDHLGTVVNELATSEKKTLSPTGELLGTAPTLSPSLQPVIYAFTGAEYAAERNQSTNGVREYDLDFGIWSTFDRAWPVDHSNGVVYGQNSPLRFIDPSGLASPATDEMTSPGNTYATASDAAYSFLSIVNPFSKAENREIGGLVIYDQSSGGYGVRNITIGTEQSVGIPLQVSAGEIRSSFAHTHAGNDARFFGEIFSEDDVSTANRYDLKSFLMTPSDVFNEYSPHGGFIPQFCPQR